MVMGGWMLIMHNGDVTFNGQIFSQKAFDAYKNIGLPTKKDEKWKYLQANWLKGTEWNLAPCMSLENSAESNLMCFDEGKCSYHLPKGFVLSLEDNIGETVFDDGVRQLIDAWSPYKLILKIPEGSHGETIQVRFRNKVHKLMMPLVIEIRCAKNSSVNIVEDVALEDGARLVSWSVCMDENSSLVWSKHESSTNESYSLSFLEASLDSEAYFEQGAFIDHTVYTKSLGYIQLNDKKAHAELNTVMISSCKQRCDYQVQIKHSSGQTTSNQFVRSLASDGSAQVFNSRVVVDPMAQKVVSQQQHKSLIMQPSAKIYSKPELEIYADDVKCNHGSAIGQLDKTGLFYLMSRGLSLEVSKSLLMGAFLKEVSSRWSTIINQHLADKLDKSISISAKDGFHVST